MVVQSCTRYVDMYVERGCLDNMGTVDKKVPAYKGRLVKVLCRSLLYVFTHRQLHQVQTVSDEVSQPYALPREKL